MRQAKNAKIIRALKLLDKINLIKDYNLTKIYSNFEKFKSNHDNHNLLLQNI